MQSTEKRNLGFPHPSTAMQPTYQDQKEFSIIF